MSKKVKSLIEKELTGKLGNLDSIAVISPRGIDGIKNNQLRRTFREQGIRMTVVKNTLARRAGDKSKIKGFDSLLDGPSALVYGKASISSIARLLLSEKKANENLELRGIFFDGEIYTGDKGIEQVSKLPTREEAISNLVGAILGPGRKLGGALKGPGGKLGGILKAIEAKAKESAPAGEPATAPA
ncbi:MAG: 50S ribosomal protein L10 [Planctomycetota bacterium]|nr:50S ribosomal protein L10 [Planctomycetota bacterium]